MKCMMAAMISILALQGCASKPTTRTQGMASGASEVLQGLESASTALKRTLTSLQIVTEGRTDVAKARDAYLADFAELETRVQNVRNHALDVSQRRDAYLKEWLAQSSTMESASMKAAAEKRRTELMNEFMTLASKAGDLRRAYAPLHSSLRDCASYLESDSTPAGAASLASEYEGIKKLEGDVAKAGSAYRAQLEKIAGLIATK